MSLARLSALALTFALAACGSDATDESAPGPTAAADSTPGHAAPATGVSRPGPLIPGGDGFLAAIAPRKGLTLHERPHGKVVARLKARTRWGSPTVVWAVERRGDWLGVVATALDNNELAWLDARRQRPRLFRTPLSLHADLSERSLELRRRGRVVRRMPVTIGGPRSPTPTGRFSVTDKLLPGPRRGYYGCCILALSGRQPQLRPGWAGGDRIAIHGSASGATGSAASAGCLRARDDDLRRLMKVVPVGTPVVIRP